MKLSISNIAWSADQDEEMYDFLCRAEIDGLEIAPTRIFPEDPYAHLREAVQFRSRMLEAYGLRISSMQSIWFGRQENIFEGAHERDRLIEYTKCAFAFAHAVACENLVFGCPKNRNIRSAEDMDIAYEFFSRLGELAESEQTVLAIEPNPPMYHTNFLNTTQEALCFAEHIASDGVRVNLDLGTMIANNEDIQTAINGLSCIHHVHISEPGLNPVTFSSFQVSAVRRLIEAKYDGYVSIEMKNTGDIEMAKATLMRLVELAEVQNVR